MSQKNENLMKDEEIIYIAKIHWFVYATPIVFLTVGIFSISVSPNYADGPALALVFLGRLQVVISLLVFLTALYKKSTTELAITTKRVIVKTGLINRNVVELNRGKIKSFKVDQSIIGRICRFGTITIQSTGGGNMSIKGIEAPLVLKREAMEIANKTVDS